VRASDVDRDRVAPVLNDALAMDKFEERLTVVYSAKTLGELAGLTGDLLPAKKQPFRLDGGRATRFSGLSSGTAAGWCPWSCQSPPRSARPGSTCATPLCRRR
jgi:hypothetical protein